MYRQTLFMHRESAAITHIESVTFAHIRSGKIGI
jgi:hypothetical protein